MNAARALRQARRRAGMSQTELARRAGVPRQLVNRIERAATVPRVDTLARLLTAAGMTLDIGPRIGTTIDRGPIGALLQAPATDRLSRPQIQALDRLNRRRVQFVVVGDAAARLHGAPVDVESVEIIVDTGPMNLRRLGLALTARNPAGQVIRTEVVHSGGPYSSLRQDAEELPWLPDPTCRVLNRWLDAPTGYLASIASLLRSADLERRELLAAVQEETDRLLPGHRIYRARQ